MNAVGLIEVIGYVAAIEACDACVKSASVNILSIDKVGAGIVTLAIVGDVGAVKSAIEAGEVAANKVGVLRATHVIPRIHKEVADNLLKKEERATQKYNKVSEILIEENENTDVETLKEDESRNVEILEEDVKIEENENEAQGSMETLEEDIRIEVSENLNVETLEEDIKVEEKKDTNTGTLKEDIKIEENENTNIEILKEDIKIEENKDTNVKTLHEDIKIEENENINTETLNVRKTVSNKDTNNRNLLNMNVKELKNLAREYDSSLTNKELNSLKKEDLVDLVDKLIRGDK
ncbi:BMC domain-containing protein [Clostridioides difficile]